MNVQFALLGEGQMLIKMKLSGPVLDADLLAAAQHVERYEIVSHAAVAIWPKLLGRQDEKKSTAS